MPHAFTSCPPNRSKAKLKNDMKTKIFLVLIAPVMVSAIIASQTFMCPLTPSGEPSDYLPFVGDWQIKGLGNRLFPEPIKLKVELINSNRMQVVMSQKTKQTTCFVSIANLQGKRFLNLEDQGKPFYDICRIQTTNSGNRIELMGINELLLEADITNSIIPGTVFEFDRGTKLIRITVTNSSRLDNYIITNRLEAFTNKFLFIDRGT